MTLITLYIVTAKGHFFVGLRRRGFENVVLFKIGHGTTKLVA
jgi:hypothetical protein